MKSTDVKAMACPRCPLYLRDSPGLLEPWWLADCGLLLRWIKAGLNSGLTSLQWGYVGWYFDQPTFVSPFA